MHAPHPRLVFVALSLALFGSACDPTVEFDVDVAQDTTIEGSALGGLIGSVGFSELVGFDISAQEEFENNQAEKDRVRSARLTAFTLTATSPDGASLDFIDDIAFFISAPGEDEVRVANATIPADATEVELDIDDVDLAPYVRADTLSLTTDVSGNQPSEDTTVEVALTFHIVAGL